MNSLLVSWCVPEDASHRAVIEWAIEAQAALGAEGARELLELADDAPVPPLPELRTAANGEVILAVYDAGWLEDLYYRLERQAPDLACDEAPRRAYRFRRAAEEVALHLRLNARGAYGPTLMEILVPGPAEKIR